MAWLYILSAVPLALFIVFLLIMDSFKLTKWSVLLLCTGAGLLMFLVSWLVCRISVIGESRLLVSAVEELCKGAVLYMLLARHRTGLLGDTSIYGSAIGAGFGLLSNVFYLAGHSEINVLHTVLLGFEAAVMHIGCTSTLAMALIMVQQGKFGKSGRARVIGTVLAFVATILIHYVHALEPINPVLLTILLVIYFAIGKRSLFRKDRKFVHGWIDECINNEISLLGAVRKGEFSGTAAGRYLLSLKNSFDSETFFDMYCYIQNYLELSIAAKSNLILREAGMEPVSDPANQDRLKEIVELRKRIGPTAELALGPIVTRNDINRWAVQNLI